MAANALTQGYHIGQYRLPPGKECPFETDIHIPLVIRGPGVPAGQVAGVVSSHTDLTPTILKLAGADRDDLDGFPIPLTAKELANPESGEHVNVEFWGRAIPEGKYGKIGNDSIPSIGGTEKNARNNTYKTLRLIGEDYNLMYTVWCTGEKQFYDLHVSLLPLCVARISCTLTNRISSAIPTRFRTTSTPPPPFKNPTA